MFRIGEFAQIAQVSDRLLRYYEEIGLLAPDHVDGATGYRWYSARQLPRLNRIIALKTLGLTLEQIGRLLDAPVSPDELRGMLTLKQAEIEQSIEAEQVKLRQVEARIRQIEEQGAMTDYDVALKSVAAQPYLSVRTTQPGMDAAMLFVRDVVRATMAQLRPGAYDRLTVVAHSDFEDEALDLDVGFVVPRPVRCRVVVGEGVALAMGELPAEAQVASVVRSGPGFQGHLAYGALGLWMEANGFRIAGPCREVVHELPMANPQTDDAVVEIQFPVRKAA